MQCCSLPRQGQYSLHAAGASRPQDRLSAVLVLRVDIRAEFQERLEDLQADLLRDRELGRSGRAAALGGVVQRRSAA